VLKALEKAGVADRTLVCFSSDNGTTHEGKADPRFHVGGADPKFFNSTAGLRGYKGSVYEGGIRVPMIARFPGRIPGGTVNDSPGYFADVFPTLCEATGTTCPDDIDGQSLWPIFTGQQKALKSHKPLVWVFPEYGGQVAVRLGDLKFVRQQLKSKQPGAWEVYDLAKDPGETHDFAKENVGKIAEVEGLLRREVAENSIFPLTIPGVNSVAQ
jgi:arylsulfatase A-like enzyme